MAYNLWLTDTILPNNLIINNKMPNKYIITYSNWFEFNNRILAFRKQKLFDITEIPTLINFNENCNSWIINRKHLTKSKAKELVKNEQKDVDVSNLQWYQQEQLNEVFNL